MGIIKYAVETSFSLFLTKHQCFANICLFLHFLITSSQNRCILQEHRAVEERA